MNIHFKSNNVYDIFLKWNYKRLGIKKKDIERLNNIKWEKLNNISKKNVYRINNILKKYHLISKLASL